MYTVFMNIISEERAQSYELNKAVEMLLIMDLEQLQRQDYKLIYDFIEFVNCCTDTSDNDKNLLESIAQYVKSSL